MQRRKLFISLFVLCLLFVSVSPTFASSWKYVTTTNAVEHYFDTETAHYITISDETYIEAWVLGVYKAVKPDGAKTYKDKLWLKLDKNAYAQRAHYVYDINGTVITSLTQRGTWHDCVPGSGGEKLYNTIKTHVEQNN